MLSTLEEKRVYRRQMNLNQIVVQPIAFLQKEISLPECVQHMKHNVLQTFSTTHFWAGHSEEHSLNQSFPTDGRKAGNTQVMMFVLSVTRGFPCQNMSGRGQ